MRTSRYTTAAAMLMLAGAGCAHLAVEGGEKPIKIDMTVTLKVDQQLDQFYSFEKKYENPSTQPTTQPAAIPATPAPTTPGGAE